MKFLSRAGIGTLVATALTAATLAFAAPSGAAAATITVNPTALGFTEGHLLVVPLLSGGGCSANITASEITLTFNGTPTTAPTVEGVGDAFFGKYQFAVDIPASLASVPGVTNTLGVSVTCNVSSVPVTFTGTFEFSQIDITKVVEGAAPAGAAYPIEVSCSSGAVAASSVGASSVGTSALYQQAFKFTLAAGQTHSLLTGGDGVNGVNGTCAITETDSLGATNTVISPSAVTVTATTTYPVTITNSYVTRPAFTG